ncbi:MAG: hypothetical protein AAGA43_15435 [Bacteroidota bacterium]
MANLKRFLIRKRRKTAEVIELKTNISTALIPTTENIKRIEVFNTKIIDPLGITLEKIEGEE